jgi:broad specificity phosphatase PhoE
VKIYFTRHGESQANVLRQISNRGLIHPLTRTGRSQAVALADWLQGRAITRIYSSPLLRAVETSVIVAERLGVEYEVTDALREFDCGIAEGRADAEAWGLWRSAVDKWLPGRDWTWRIPDGENFCDLRDRFVPFVERLVAEYGATDANLLCVAHGGILWMMLPLVLANVDNAVMAQRGFGHGMRVVAELGPDGLRCVEWEGVRV